MQSLLDALQCAHQNRDDAEQHKGRQRADDEGEQKLHRDAASMNLCPPASLNAHIMRQTSQSVTNGNSVAFCIDQDSGQWTNAIASDHRQRGKLIAESSAVLGSNNCITQRTRDGSVELLSNRTRGLSNRQTGGESNDIEVDDLGKFNHHYSSLLTFLSYPPASAFGDGHQSDDNKELRTDH